ncbi:hypothetical protein ACWGI8_28650 [Streptomyces sp. NPDC054841]
MGRVGPHVRRTPPAGGVKWDRPPEALREATPQRRLGAGTARANARSRGEICRWRRRRAAAIG